MSQSPKIIITGSRGRFGKAILAGSPANWKWLSFSRSSGDGHASFEDLFKNQTPLDAAALIHCAWSTVPAVAEANPTLGREVDLPMLQRLITRLQGEAAPPLFIFMSTGAVYGSAPGRASQESDAPNPQGVYAHDKLAAEAMLRASGLPICILRVSNVYALASKPSDAQGVLAHLIRAALNGKTFTRWGLNPVKDYLHRTDFLTALQLIVQQRLEGTWNLASGVGTSLETLISLVEKNVQTSLDIASNVAPLWDVPDNRLDSSALQKALQWQPHVSIEEGIQSEVENMRLAL